MGTINDALNSAFNTFDADTNAILTQFATFADNKRAQITLDIFTLLFAVGNIGVWNKGKNSRAHPT